MTQEQLTEAVLEVDRGLHGQGKRAGYYLTSFADFDELLRLGVMNPAPPWVSVTQQEHGLNVTRHGLALPTPAGAAIVLPHESVKLGAVVPQALEDRAKAEE